MNAVLNYVFALLEAEAVMACHAVGLDPGFGLIHLDSRSRQSLALDVMEVARPAVEAFALDLLAARTFRKGDFIESADGHCRLATSVTHDLAETLPQWRSLVGPVAERVAHSLGRAMAGKYVAHTPLTGRRGIEAQAVVKARKAAARTTAVASWSVQRPRSSGRAALWSCPDCGGPVSHRDRIRCDTCIDTDPGQAPALRAKRGQAIASRKRALRERADAGLPEHCDRDWYRREILPLPANLKLAEIMVATGCVEGLRVGFRKGTCVPHVAAWAALCELVGHPLG